MLFSVMATAQVDATFQFVDAEGNEVKDGSVIVVKTIDEEGQMVVPLFVKNMSGGKAAGSIYETVNQKPGGEWRTCAFGNCITLTANGYSPKSVVAADYHNTIMTEWVPVKEQYATWEATLQIQVFDWSTQQQWGEDVDVPGNTVIGYGPKVTVRFEYTANSEGGAALDQFILGSYVSDEYVTDLYYSAGFPRYPGVLKVANNIPANELAAFQGAQIVNMRVAFALAPGASSFFIIPYSKQGKMMKSVFETTVDDPKAGWNEVTLTTPYTIDTEKIGGLLLGFSYTQLNTNDGQYYNDECYPLSIVDNGHDYALMLSGHTTSGEWSNLGAANLSVQAFVEGTFAANSATPSDYGSMVVPFGGSTDKTIVVRNTGAKGISSLSYVLSAEGVNGEEQTMTLSKPFMEFNGFTTIDIPMPSSAKEGTETRTITITKVNGQPNKAGTKSAKGLVASTSRKAEKRVVVEEYTGTGCGWCPRGLVGMEKMRQQFGDKFIGIGLHQYNSSDAMYISPNSYAPVYFSGAPSSQVNRSGEADPYSGAPSAVAYMLNVPAKVDVSVKGTWNETQTKVDATATVNSLIDGVNFSIEYVLVADGLSGSGTAWNQSNYYYQYSASQVPEDLQQFASGGTNGTSSIKGWTFNDVAIACSYSGGVNKATPLKSVKADEDVTNTFTLTMPTKTTLKSAIDNDKVFLVALVIDEDGTITNAARFPMAESTNAIRGIENEHTVPAYYTLDGKRQSAPAKGLNIVRMSDGRTLKVVKR